MSQMSNLLFVSIAKAGLVCIIIQLFLSGLILKDKDGNALPASAQICPVNNVFHALFKSVNVRLNNVEINSTSSSEYAHIAYLAEGTSMSIGAKVDLPIYPSRSLLS